jgi:hypothetical protein
MFNAGKNIRIINYDSVIIILILFFGVLIYNNSNSSKSALKKNPVSFNISVSESSAISSSCIHLQALQKSWISNKDNFNFSTTGRNQISENKLTSLKIIRLQTERISSCKIPPFIPGYHLYPSETDEPPHLS